MSKAIDAINQMIRGEYISSAVYIRSLNNTENRLSLNVFVELLHNSQNSVFRLIRLKNKLKEAEALVE